MHCFYDLVDWIYSRAILVFDQKEILDHDAYRAIRLHT